MSIGPSEEEARIRWGRVLAGEIRAPGTFSNSAMRLIDEMDSEVGRIFESLCTSLLRFFVPKELANLSIADELLLTNAGLLSPRSDLSINFKRKTDDSADQILRIGDKAIIIPAFYDNPETSSRTYQSGLVRVPCYSLTKEGLAIATLMPDRSFKAMVRLALSLSASYHGIEVYKAIEGAETAHVVERWRELAEEASREVDRPSSVSASD